MPALTDVLEQRGHEAFLLTVGPDGPHTSHVTVELDGDRLIVDIGHRVARNVRTEPNVSIFWPPLENEGYSMIVNAIVESYVESAEFCFVSMKPEKAVLHRPGRQQNSQPGGCRSDCVGLALPGA